MTVRCRQFGVVCFLVWAGLAGGNSVALAQGRAVDWNAIKLPYERPGGLDLTRIASLRDGRVLVKGPDLKSNQEFLRRYANGLVFPVTQESYYVLPDTGDLKPRAENQNFDSVIRELNYQLLVPIPSNNLASMQPAQAEYIREFGVAFDEAFAKVFALPALPPVVRANAARLLAIAARSGAPAHAKMVHAMLTNDFFKKDGMSVETPPEVLYYALRAAGSLLAAYDLTVQNSSAARRHALPEADLHKLIDVLSEMVIKGPPVLDKVAMSIEDRFGAGAAVPEGEAPAPQAGPEGAPAAQLDAKSPTEQQVRVVQFFRREAIKALAACRFDLIGGARDVRPGYPLALVAVNDASLSFPATPADAVEAVVGLCNMEPSDRLEVPVYTAAIGSGLRAVVGPRLVNPSDKSLPWKAVSVRLTTGLNILKRRTQVNPLLRTQARLIDQLVEIGLRDLAEPLNLETAGGLGQPNVNQLDAWLANLGAEANKSFYTDQANFTLKPRPAGR